MPPTTTKTLSPAELAKLEHAFATDPASEAYRPLAEAYLGMGRFMEAMVVCKKGVKAHPSKPDPRVLLARVYAEQGKDKKALEELAGAMGVAPNDKLVLRMTGALQLKTGEAAAGKTNLLKALEIDPADEETKAIFGQYKVDLPKPPAPPPPPEPVAPPPPPPQPTNGSTAGVQALANGAQGPRPHAQPPPRPSGSRPRTPTQPPRRVVEEYPSQENSVSGISEVSEISELSEVGGRRHRRRGGSGATVTIALVILVIVGLSAYYGIGQYRARKTRETNAKLVQAIDALKGDSYDAYQKAAKLAEEAITNSPDSAKAHAIDAYANVVRWGEHGGDEGVMKRAEEHLTDAIKYKSGPDSYVYATEALLKFYGGKGDEAIKALKPIVTELEEKNGRPSLLYLTLGLMQSNAGDLDAAKDNLEKAQQAASDDPRVYSALGTLARRRGNDGDALKHYNTALKYTRNSHPEALLGTALLILDQENPALGYVTAAKYVKTLLDSEPPPSPRQLAMAHMVRAFLVSRVTHDIKLYDSKEVQDKLREGTGVDGDPAKGRSEVQKEEDQAMQDKSNPELYLVRGKRYMYEDNLTGAADEIRKAIGMNSHRAYYYVELAKALMRKEGGEKEAEDALQKALQTLPDSPKILTLLGQAQYKQKKIEEARATYERAIKAKNAEARFALGRIYRDDKKDFVKSAEFFEQAAKEFVGDSMMVSSSYDEAGVSWEQKGDRAKAKQFFENALNAEREYDRPYCDYARFLSKGPDAAKDKELIKTMAAQYIKLSPKGECAAEMTPLSH